MSNWSSVEDSFNKLSLGACVYVIDKFKSDISKYSKKQINSMYTKDKFEDYVFAESQEGQELVIPIKVNILKEHKKSIELLDKRFEEMTREEIQKVLSTKGPDIDQYTSDQIRCFSIHKGDFYVNLFINNNITGSYIITPISVQDLLEYVKQKKCVYDINKINNAIKRVRQIEEAAFDEEFDNIK